MTEAQQETALTDFAIVRPEVSGWQSRSATQTGVNAAFCQLVRESGSFAPAHRWTMTCLLCGIVVAVGTWWISQNLLVVSIAFQSGVVAPMLVLAFQRYRRRREISSQVVDFIESTARHLFAGISVRQSLSMSSDSSGAPLGDEINRRLAASDLNQGHELLASGQTGDDWPDLNMCAAIIEQHRQVGGNVGEALFQFAQRIRQRHRVQRRLNAATSGGKLALVLMLILPPLIVAFYQWQDRSYVERILNSRLGQLSLAAALSLQILGVTITWSLVSRLAKRISSGWSQP